MNASFNKVFISYASEDFKVAIQLFDYLSVNGFDPWLDKLKLLPGQQWDIEITRALREADYIILLLSNISVNKRGYVQKEFKLAATFVTERLHSDIYVIPCKLDDCSVPHFLESFQWVHYTDDQSFPKILSSLQLQRDVYQRSMKADDISKSSYAFDLFEKSFNTDTTPQSIVKVSYFQFNDTSNDDLVEINEIVKAQALIDFRSSKKLILDESVSAFSDRFKHNHTNVLFNSEENYKLQYISENFASIKVNSYSYLGGVHGNYSTSSHNFSLSPFTEISSEVLFSSNTDALRFIASECRRSIVHKIRLHLADPDLTEDDCFIVDYELALEPFWSNFSNFLITQNSIDFIFNPYEVTAYVFGQHIISIKYKELLNKFSNLRIIKKLNQDKSIYTSDIQEFQ